MSGMEPLEEYQAESMAAKLKQTVENMGPAPDGISVDYRLNVTGTTSTGNTLDVTEFRISGFTSFYAEDIPELLPDETYIVSMGVHVDTDDATISMVRETGPRVEIFV